MISGDIVNKGCSGCAEYTLLTKLMLHQTDKRMAKEIRCDGCGAKLDYDKNYFSVHVANTIHDHIYDMCAACIKYQKIPIQPNEMELFSVQKKEKGPGR